MNPHIHLVLFFARALVRARFSSVIQYLEQTMMLLLPVISELLFVSLESFLVMFFIFLIVTALAVVTLFIVLFWIIRVIGLLESFNWEDVIRKKRRSRATKWVDFLRHAIRVNASPIYVRLALEVVHKCTEILFVLRVLEEGLWIVLDEVAWNLFVCLLSQIIKQL